jgi:prophage tail gpP-like protein
MDATDISGRSLGRPMDELSLLINGQKISGWEDVSVTLRLEGFPNEFDIALSSPSGALLAKAGDECGILLGDDQVLTGYVDQDFNLGDAGSHTLRLRGRGKTCDLVDCSAEWPAGQLQGTALDIATKLSLPYGIGVELGDGADAGPQVTPWALNYGDTAADIIQRVARNAGLLAYEDPSGKLILGKVGSAFAASGIAYGANVQAWSVQNSMAERYSEMVCCSLSMAAWGDLPGSDFFDIEKDPNVPRHRRRDIVLEQVAEDPQAFTIKKAKWEIARRAGHGYVVTATVDSWRDSAGRLWKPNTLIPIDVPGMRGDKMLCIAEVTFGKSGETGTTAEIVAMPSYAFTPEPLSLVPAAIADVVGP